MKHIVVHDRDSGRPTLLDAHRVIAMAEGDNNGSVLWIHGRRGPWCIRETPLDFTMLLGHDPTGSIGQAFALKDDGVVESLFAALTQIVDEKCDYMRLNHLGDPEIEHTIKAARAAMKFVHRYGGRYKWVPDGMRIVH